MFDFKKTFRKLCQRAERIYNAISSFYLRQCIFKGRFIRLHNYLLLLAWFSFGFMLMMLFFDIFLLGSKVGPWYIVCTLSYLALLFAASFLLHQRKAKIELHAMIGDEEYYKCYPKDLERDIRRLERALGLQDEEEGKEYLSL